MQFLMIARRRLDAFSEAEIEPYLEPEAERVRELYAEGVFRHMWQREDVPGAVALIEAVDIASAQRAVDTLPFVEQQMLETTIIPLRAYRGFVPKKPLAQTSA